MNTYPMDPSRPPHPSYEQRPSWWSRNWKWAVPTGCLGVATIFLLIIGFIAAIAMGVFGLLKSSGAYELAMERARSSIEVRQALGEPVEAGWWVMGNVQINGPSGTANISIPLTGPDGEGTLYVEATKRANLWSFSLLELEVKGSGERIDLLSSGTM